MHIDVCGMDDEGGGINRDNCFFRITSPYHKNALVIDIPNVEFVTNL